VTSVRAAEPKARPTAKEPRSAAVGTPLTDDERNAEVRAKLAKRMNLEFIETPLNQVLDFLSDGAAVQIHIKTRALDDVGIGQDAPISLNLIDVSVETGLELMLDELQLDFAIDRGLVIVSTPDDLRAKSVVRVYQLEPLLADVSPEQIDREAGGLAGIIAAQVAPDTWGSVEMPPVQAPAGAAAPGMMGEMPGMGMPGTPRLSGAAAPGGLPGTVHLGGPGAISVFHRLLIVRNSIKVQDQVDQFLRTLVEATAVGK
jgi:hypothetical protein